MRAILRILRRARELLILTNLGAVVLLGGAAAYFGFGVPRADYAVQIVAVLAMALVIGALFVVIIGALLTHFAIKSRTRDEAPPLQFEAVRGFGAALAMPSRSWFPLLEIEWVWEEPTNVDVERAQIEGELIEQIEAKSRNYSREVRRRFIIEDGFGLARIVLRRVETREIRIVPWAGALDRSPLLRSLASGDDLPHPQGALDGDRVDMRRYVPGDPLRLALWKVYARTRVLMVRTPERAIAPAVRVAAYLPSAEGDEAASAAARVAVEGGLLGDRWVFGTDGSDASASTTEEAVQQILESRRVRGTPEGDGAGLSRFLDAASDAEPARVVLFVPGVHGPWLETVTQAVRHHRGGVSAVIVVDGVVTDAPTKDLAERLLRVPEPEEQDGVVTLASIGSVAQQLARSGAEVGAVDRVTGRSIHLGLGTQRWTAEDQRSVA